jgi:hypothetical protein
VSGCRRATGPYDMKASVRSGQRCRGRVVDVDPVVADLSHWDERSPCRVELFEKQPWRFPPPVDPYHEEAPVGAGGNRGLDGRVVPGDDETVVGPAGKWGSPHFWVRIFCPRIGNDGKADEDDGKEHCWEATEKRTLPDEPDHRDLFMHCPDIFVLVRRLMGPRGDFHAGIGGDRRSRSIQGRTCVQDLPCICTRPVQKIL